MAEVSASSMPTRSSVASVSPSPSPTWSPFAKTSRTAKKPTTMAATVRHGMLSLRNMHEVEKQDLDNQTTPVFIDCGRSKEGTGRVGLELFTLRKTREMMEEMSGLDAKMTSVLAAAVVWTDRVNARLFTAKASAPAGPTHPCEDHLRRATSRLRRWNAARPHDKEHA